MSMEPARPAGAPLPTAVLNAINCLGAYVLATLAHWVWVGLEVGWLPEEGLRAAFRSVVAAAIAFGLARRRRWAWWAGVAAGLVGAFSLLALAVGVADSGMGQLALGLVTAGFTAVWAVCLAGCGMQLGHPSAREALVPKT
ncbi:MAG: hypothetical protein HY554_15330 [Elusimicrobia bacterium]|nr:hypothetical protein [Elusimicrobiota bacterium]